MKHSQVTGLFRLCMYVCRRSAFLLKNEKSSFIVKLVFINSSISHSFFIFPNLGTLLSSLHW